MGTRTLFYTMLPLPPSPYRPPTSWPSIQIWRVVSLPCFTEDHVVGAPFPPPALHPDLGLTSPLTGVSRPDSCGPCGEQLPPRPWHLPRSRLQWESSPGQAGPSLQLPGLGHDGRDMLLFLILFFYEKNQCQFTDPLRNQAGRAEPASPPQLRG